MARKPRVVIVDDEWIIAETLRLILQRVGFSATSFNDPLKALEGARSEPLDLLISDVMMPRLSGVDLAIQIRSIHPKCGVMLFSGQAQTTDLLQSARALGHEFSLLTKPLHPRELLRQIKVNNPQWESLSSTVWDGVQTP